MYIEILDLPPNKRTLEENLSFAGLWFGVKSPAMKTFLKPNTKSLLDLEEKGIHVTLSDRGQLTCKAILSNGNFDLPAWCMVCNMMQYNGLCGCGTCEEPGETFKVGKGHSHIYPMSHEMAKSPDGHAVLGTKENTKMYAEEALRSESLVTGIKGPSMLSYLPNFEITKGVPIDYMHGVLLGMTKNLLNYWFNPKYNQEDWYCDNKITDVDKILASIRPPDEITRLPRSIGKPLSSFMAIPLCSTHNVCGIEGPLCASFYVACQSWCLQPLQRLNFTARLPRIFYSAEDICILYG